MIGIFERSVHTRHMSYRVCLLALVTLALTGSPVSAEDADVTSITSCWYSETTLYATQEDPNPSTTRTTNGDQTFEAFGKSSYRVFSEYFIDGVLQYGHSFSIEAGTVLAPFPNWHESIANTTTRFDAYAASSSWAKVGDTPLCSVTIIYGPDGGGSGGIFWTFDPNRYLERPADEVPILPTTR